MSIAIIIAFLLVFLTFTFHYKILLGLGIYGSKLKLKPELQVFQAVIVLFVSHIIEIAFYGLAYYFSIVELKLGDFGGEEVKDPMSYLYYSGVIFTSLGLGDSYPQGHVRFITAIESLNGFLLVTWSASYTFLVMSRLWRFSGCNEDKPK